MSKVLWVAEVGSMHKGSPPLAYEMIRQFSEAGADIIKFQFGWTAEVQSKYGHVYNPIRYVDNFARDLALWCKEFGVELMASIWSTGGLMTAREVGMQRYKVAHQMQDTELLKDILSDGKETFISDRVGGGEFSNVRGIFCSPKYPTYHYELKLPNKFAGYYGYSDHTPGIEACLLAIARGALYIEKHACLDKTDLSVKDTPFSATPQEFEQMVKLGNGIRRILDATSYAAA